MTDTSNVDCLLERILKKILWFFLKNYSKINKHKWCKLCIWKKKKIKNLQFFPPKLFQN
jgi:hypothetical protein